MNGCYNCHLYIYMYTFINSIYSSREQASVWYERTNILWVLCWLSGVLQCYSCLLPHLTGGAETKTKRNPSYYLFYKNLQLQQQESLVNLNWKTQLEPGKSSDFYFGIGLLSQDKDLAKSKKYDLTNFRVWNLGLPHMLRCPGAQGKRSRRGRETACSHLQQRGWTLPVFPLLFLRWGAKQTPSL